MSRHRNRANRPGRPHSVRRPQGAESSGQVFLPTQTAWVLPLAGLAPTPRAPRRARSPTVPRPAAVSRLCDRATPTHHRAGRRARRALRTPRAGARTITIRGSSPRSERSAPTRSRIGSASAGPAQRSWSSCLAERLAGRQAQQDGARAGVMPARDPAWPTIPSGGGLPTPPPPSPPAAAVARSSARRPPLPPSPLRAHALTAVAAVAVAAVAVAAVATAAARLLRRCSTGRRLLAAATPAAPLSITRRSSPEARVKVPSAAGAPVCNATTLVVGPPVLIR